MSDPTRAESPLERARAIQCERICDRFEQAWRAVQAGSDRPCLDDFLAEASEPERETLLKELIQVEIDYRRQLGERPARDDYRVRFAALSVEWLNELLSEPATLPYEAA